MASTRAFFASPLLLRRGPGARPPVGGRGRSPSCPAGGLAVGGMSRRRTCPGRGRLPDAPLPTRGGCRASGGASSAGPTKGTSVAHQRFLMERLGRQGCPLDPGPPLATTPFIHGVSSWRRSCARQGRCSEHTTRPLLPLSPHFLRQDLLNPQSQLGLPNPQGR